MAMASKTGQQEEIEMEVFGETHPLIAEEPQQVLPAESLAEIGCCDYCMVCIHRAYSNDVHLHAIGVLLLVVLFAIIVIVSALNRHE